MNLIGIVLDLILWKVTHQLYRPTNNDMQVYRIHTRSVKVFIFYK